MATTVVEGTVSRLNKSGNGYGVKEVNSYGDKERVTYWSVFPPKDADRTVVEGQRVKVSGFLGTRVSERDARFVDHTLNQAKVLESVGVALPPVNLRDHRDGPPVGVAPVVDAGPVWNTPAADSEIPF